MQKGFSAMDKKSVWSWVMYDWANSAFYTTIVAGFFPLFFKIYWSDGVDELVTTSRLGFSVSITSLCIAVLSPILGTITDMKSLKKIVLMACVALGSIAIVALAMTTRGNWDQAMILYCVALFMVTASCLMYDGLLPQVAVEKDLDRVSSLGYSMGYLGGGLLFTVNVLMYLMPFRFGLENGIDAVKVSFITVSIWWFLFSLPLFYWVKERKSTFVEKVSIKAIYLSNKNAFLDILRNKNLFYQLLASWFILDGVNTVITMAVDYGATLKLGTVHLIAALLITQFVGFPFAYLFGNLASKYGCRKLVLFAAGVYGITILVASQISLSWHFYVLAFLIGTVQGCVQALSRSLFAKLTPVEKSGEYFAIYNLIGKYSSIFGAFLVAITVQMTGEPRYGILSILILFLIGSIFLYKVKEPGFSKV